MAVTCMQQTDRSIQTYRLVGILSFVRFFSATCASATADATAGASVEKCALKSVATDGAAVVVERRDALDAKLLRAVASIVRLEVLLRAASCSPPAAAAAACSCTR